MFKPEIIKHKNMRGNRIIGYSAKLGALNVGPYKTKDQALESINLELFDALKRLDQGAWLFTQHGIVVMIAPTIHGYCYWVVADTSTGRMNGVNYPASDTKDQIEARARMHAAHAAWSEDCQDDYWFIDPVNIPRISKSDREDLLAWINFQRHHIEFKRQGIDHQCRHDCKTVKDRSLLKGNPIEVSA